MSQVVTPNALLTYITSPDYNGVDRAWGTSSLSVDNDETVNVKRSNGLLCTLCMCSAEDLIAPTFFD